MRKVNVWVFDLDDTLMANVHDYAYPILDSCRLIIDALGDTAPDVSFVVALENEIDLRRRGEINPATGLSYGCSMERFPTSLVETYREICQRAGKSPVRSVESDLLYIGLRAFDPARYKRNLYPDAISTLNFLQDRGDLILLLTKGDKKVQGKKLSVLDAGSRFFKVKIVDSKTPQIFQEMINGLENVKLFSVGSDYDKDIVPALETGYHRGVWIPVETWEIIGQLEKIRAKADWSRTVEISSLRDLIERYDEITGCVR